MYTFRSFYLYHEYLLTHIFEQVRPGVAEMSETPGIVLGGDVFIEAATQMVELGAHQVAHETPRLHRECH